MIAWHVVPTEKAASISKRINHGSIRLHTAEKRMEVHIEREAIGMMSDYLNMGQMDAAPRLNGAAPRAKFADVVLPTFPQRRNHTA